MVEEAWSNLREFAEMHGLIDDGAMLTCARCKAQHALDFDEVINEEDEEGNHIEMIGFITMGDQNLIWKCQRCGDEENQSTEKKIEKELNFPLNKKSI